MIQYTALKIPGAGGSQTDVSAPEQLKHLSKDSAFGQNIILTAIVLILILAVMLSLVFLVLGGIQWILSGGDKNKLEAARNKIMYAIIGLVVSLSGFFIVNLIGSIFGVKLI